MTKTLVVAALLALAACGKSERKGDCAKAVGNAIDLSKADYARDGVVEATQTQIRDASLARCREDKWTNAVLVCFEDAKSVDDLKNCQTQLTKDQRDAMGKSITAIITAAEKTAPPDTTPDAGAPADDAGAAAALPAGLPAECAEYKAVIDKLAACDKLPPAARDMLTKSFEAQSQAWTGVDQLPDEAKSALGNACKQGVDAVKKAVTGTCEL